MLYDTLARRRPAGLQSTVIFALARITRRIVVQVYDPLVDYAVGASSIKIPLSHNLGIFFRNDPDYAGSLARLAQAARQKYPDLHFIDVGANVGDTTPLLRAKARFPILAIEGDLEFFALLERNSRAFPDVTTVACFLGEESRVEAGLEFVSRGGTGHLEKSEAAAGTKTVRLDELLDEYPAFKDAKMIKVDTDGFDAKVLRGAAAYLKRARPVVFFEYAPELWRQQGEDCVSIFSFLAGAGYPRLLAFQPSGELLGSGLTDDRSFVEKLRAIEKKFYYCDLCAFAEEDLDLFERVRKSESSSREVGGRVS